MHRMGLKGKQERLIEKVAAENGFASYQIETKSGSGKGDNFVGLITSVTIVEGGKKLELILKAAPMGAVRDQMNVRQAYLREIYIYERVFPKFEEFQEEFGVANPFRSYPKPYGSCNEEFSECLVMEDLRCTGFSLWNRKLPMDHDHLVAVIIEYARFHAVSLAMREKNPEDYKQLTDPVRTYIYEEYLHVGTKTDVYVEAVMSNIYEVFVDDPSTMAKLIEYRERIPDIFEEIYRQPDNSVIDHGDCWCNNFMFKYENPEAPTVPSAVRIIDWQVSKMSSPAMDLACFFLIQSPKEILHDYETYLKVYHETLSKSLRALSCDPEIVFPYSVLLEHWNKRIQIGIFFAFHLLKIMMSDPGEAPEFSDVFNSGKNISGILAYATQNEGAFRGRIKDLVEFCIVQKFI